MRALDSYSFARSHAKTWIKDAKIINPWQDLPAVSREPTIYAIACFGVFGKEFLLLDDNIVPQNSGIVFVREPAHAVTDHLEKHRVFAGLVGNSDGVGERGCRG